MKKTTWLAILFVSLVLGYIFYTSFSPPKFRCRVCMAFNGRQDCRTASAETRESALRTAITNACAEIAFTRSESNECERIEPASVTWLQ